MDTIKFPQNVCVFCKKREATLLCDKVTGVMTYAGHPPKINGVTQNWPMESIMHCSRPMCEKCATNITGMDLCPKCLKEIKAALGA